MMLWLSVSVIKKTKLHGIILKTGANLGLKCGRMRFAAGLRPHPLGELQRSPRHPSRNSGEGCLLLRGREGKGMGKRKEEKGRGRREREGWTPVPDWERAKVATLG